MTVVQVEVERFDGEKNYFSQYRLVATGTVLDLLHHIKNEYDSSLTFVANCRSGICGACAVRVNALAVLACSTPVEELLTVFKTNTLLIQPLANYQVIRDLVVDWEPKVERLCEIKPWLIVDPSYDRSHPPLQSAAELEKYNIDTHCSLCGICVSSCSKLSCDDRDYYEPYVYAKAHRFLNDCRHTTGKQQLQAVLAKGLWKCMHCQECVANCPQQVSAAQDIANLKARSLSIDNKNLGAKHALAFYHDIRTIGRLDETLLAPKTEGLLKAALRLPTAIKLLRHGKIHILPLREKINTTDIRKILKMLPKQGERS